MFALKSVQQLPQSDIPNHDWHGLSLALSAQIKAPGISILQHISPGIGSDALMVEIRTPHGTYQGAFSYSGNAQREMADYYALCRAAFLAGLIDTYPAYPGILNGTNDATKKVSEIACDGFNGTCLGDGYVRDWVKDGALKKTAAEVAELSREMFEGKTYCIPCGLQAAKNRSRQ